MHIFVHGCMHAPRTRSTRSRKIGSCFALLASMAGLPIAFRRAPLDVSCADICSDDAPGGQGIRLQLIPGLASTGKGAEQQGKPPLQGQPALDAQHEWKAFRAG